MRPYRLNHRKKDTVRDPAAVWYRKLYLITTGSYKFLFTSSEWYSICIYYAREITGHEDSLHSME
jgi:hypothetical protein